MPIDEATLERSPFETVLDGIQNREEITATATLGTVGHIAAPVEDGGGDLPRVDHLFAFGGLLGTGGTAEVLAAEQSSLGRVIAIKRRRADSSSASVRPLLREARVIGHLEHPNIPPVHFVGSNDDGELLVGLKRIEGRNLAEEAVPGPDTLDANLDVLISVCNAVEFAHDRGILHLDIKPENVMVGAFGEIYVVDWGLAVAWRSEVPASIPRLPRDGNLRGTPAFIPPEMIVNEAATPATDVFLLGGLLYWMLTGSGPNLGETSLDAIRFAYGAEEPPFPDWVPSSLVAVCRRALSHEPAARFETAFEFRAALVAFRRDRRKDEALEAAVAAVTAVERALAADDSSQVYQRLGAARQAAEEAVRVGSEESLDEVLAPVVEKVIQWELGRENTGGAEALLATLENPPPRLVRELESLVRQKRRDREDLAAFREYSDLAVGGKTAATMGALIGTVFVITESISRGLGLGPTPERILAAYVIYCGVLALSSWGLRGVLLGTRSNRGKIATIWFLSAMGLTVRIMAWLGVMELHAALAVDLAVVALAAGFTGLMFDPRIWLCIPGYTVFAVLCAAFPQESSMIFAVSHFVGLSTVSSSLAFMRPREPWG